MSEYEGADAAGRDGTRGDEAADADSLSPGAAVIAGSGIHAFIPR